MTEHRHGGAPIPQKPDGKEPGKDGEKKDADWGLSEEKPAMSRETKIGLALVVVLVAAFGFVVFKKLQQRDELFTEDPDNNGSSYVKNSKRHSHDHSHAHKKEGTVIPPYDGRKKRAPFPEDDHHNHTTGLFGGQSEPGGHSHSHDGHNHGTGNPFDQNNQNQNHSGQFEADALAETSISGMTWIFTQPPPPPPAPLPESNPWDLGGGEKHHVSNSNNTQPGENPFAQSGKSGETPSFENTPGLNDGFRSADSAGSGKVQVFPAGHRHPHTESGHNHGDQTGTNELFPSDGTKTTSSGQFPNHGQTSPFGSDQHQHTKDEFLPTPKRDRRLGAYQVGTDSHSHGGSSTHVHSGNELEYPFGKPSNSGSGSSPFDTAQPRRRRGFKPAPTPEPVDGHHHFPNGQPVGPVDYSADRPTVHTVAYGENYWSISQKAYGAGKYYQALAAYNSYRISDPKKMRPGMKVLIPAIGILAKRHPKLCPRHASADHTHAGGHGHQPSGFFRSTDGQPMYRVGKTDTLSDIAQKHLGRASRWIQVYRMNERLITNPNRLKIGTELILPADASRVSLVPTPTRYR